MKSDLPAYGFTGQKYFASTLPDEHIFRETPVLSEAKEWLNVYFSGKRAGLHPAPFILAGSEFRQAVWQILLQIPYGQTTTYGEIARQPADVEKDSRYVCAGRRRCSGA